MCLRPTKRFLFSLPALAQDRNLRQPAPTLGCYGNTPREWFGRHAPRLAVLETPPQNLCGHPLRRVCGVASSFRKATNSLFHGHASDRDSIRDEVSSRNLRQLFINVPFFGAQSAILKYQPRD
jgi:hypothetical protein